MGLMLRWLLVIEVVDSESHDRKYNGKQKISIDNQYWDLEMGLWETRSIEGIGMREQRDSPVFLSLWSYVKTFSLNQKMFSVLHQF
jgi:hypothetical protein